MTGNPMKNLPIIFALVYLFSPAAITSAPSLDNHQNPKSIIKLSPDADRRAQLGTGIKPDYLLAIEYSTIHNSSPTFKTILYSRNGYKCNLNFNFSTDAKEVYIESIYQLTSETAIITWHESLDSYYKVTIFDMKSCTIIKTLTYSREVREFDHEFDYNDGFDLMYYKDGFDVIRVLKNGTSFRISYDLNGNQIDQLQSSLLIPNFDYFFAQSLSQESRSGNIVIFTDNYHPRRVSVNLVSTNITHVKKITDFDLAYFRFSVNHVIDIDQSFSTSCWSGSVPHNSTMLVMCMQFDKFGNEMYKNHTIPRRRGAGEYVVGVHNLREGGMVLFTRILTEYSLLATEMRPGCELQETRYPLAWKIGYMRVIDFNETERSFNFVYVNYEDPRSISLQNYFLPSEFGQNCS